MDTILFREILKHAPDVAMPPTSRECAPDYWAKVAEGEAIAAETALTVVGLVRDSMPWLHINAARTEELGQKFLTWNAFLFENDSTDGTAEELAAWQKRTPQVSFQSERLGRPMLSTEKTKRRTDALAGYRQRCLEWAKANRPTPGTRHVIIVIDFDTWGGWSNHGVMSGLAWLERLPAAGGLASVSTIEYPNPNEPTGKSTIHYDAWAFRHNHWTEHPDMGWFHGWFPPVGSEPVPVRSAFGGLCIYRPDAYFAGTYSGGDCEHVNFHRSILEPTGYRMYLNPGQRGVMNWIRGEPVTDGRQHGDDHDAGVPG